MLRFILAVAGYLIGSIPVGVLVGRIYGFDPRTVGSRNIGMSNVVRAGGTMAGALTFVGDAFKGLLPVMLARAAHLTAGGLAEVGLAAFLGSIRSVFLGLGGGKGVATSVGVWLGLAPAPIGIALAAFVVAVAITRIMSVASMCAAISLPPAVAASGCPRPYVLLAIVMAALVLLRHRENIQRLLNGEEPRISSGKSGTATPAPGTSGPASG